MKRIITLCLFLVISILSISFSNKNDFPPVQKYLDKVITVIHGGEPVEISQKLTKNSYTSTIKRKNGYKTYDKYEKIDWTQYNRLETAVIKEKYLRCNLYFNKKIDYTTSDDEEADETEQVYSFECFILLEDKEAFYDVIKDWKEAADGIKNEAKYNSTSPAKKQTGGTQNDDPFAMISMKDIESLMKNPLFRDLLTAKSLFTSGPLQVMEQKATSPDTYEDALKSSQNSKDVKRTFKTENKTKGVHFQYLSNSKTVYELFFDDNKQFCYYNKITTKEEITAAEDDLKAKGFSFKTTVSKDDGFVVTWKKDGYPYTVVMQYGPGKPSGNVALLANSFLGNSKIE